MRKPHFEANFNLLDRTDLFIRLHIMFQISLQSSKKQKKLSQVFRCSVRTFAQYIYVAKTKALISCAVTLYLICTFVFAYAKSRFFHDAAHIETRSMILSYK